MSNPGVGVSGLAGSLEASLLGVQTAASPCVLSPFSYKDTVGWGQGLPVWPYFTRTSLKAPSPNASHTLGPQGLRLQHVDLRDTLGLWQCTPVIPQTHSVQEGWRRSRISGLFIGNHEKEPWFWGMGPCWPPAREEPFPDGPWLVVV